MDSKAIREINLKNGKNCVLIPKQDLNKLAESILFLKNNEKKRKEIAVEGRKIYEENFSMAITSKILVGYLNEMISKNH